jgi:hypothetical protein
VRTVALGCLDGDHEHRVIAKRLQPPEHPRIRITAWLCPVLRTAGLLIEDEGRDPSTIASGGPLP